MSRKVYVVTRIVWGSRHGSEIPTLGVHSTRKAARAHFDSVLSERLTRGAVTHWQHTRDDLHDLGDGNLQRAYLTHLDGATEELRLETWETS